MRKIIQREPPHEELSLAIGLIWGHLNTEQFEQAALLARGCLCVWPAEPRLLLMAAFASVELALPLSPEMRASLKNSQCEEWAAMVLRRAENDAASFDGTAN